MPLLLILAGLLLLVPVGTASAQTERLHFEHLTIEQGLSHNFVMRVMQDRKGYLWFGNGNGLDKYDGYRFTNYKFDPQDTTTIPKNQVFLMWEDKDGIIWIGTSEGTCKFDPLTEKFTRLERNASNPYAFKYAQSFNEDTEGNLWVGGSFEGELRQIDRKTGRFSATNYATMLKPHPDSILTASERLHIIYKDRRGILWIGSPWGLHRLNLTPQEPDKPSKISFTHFRHDPANPNSLSPSGISGIYEDRKGIFWVTTHQGVLHAFEPDTGKFSRYLPANNKPLRIFSLLGSGIAEDLKGNLWIGTRDGLYKFDKERKVFTLYQHDPTDPASLTDNNIIALLVDRAGALWLTTSMGIDKVDPNQKPFGVLRPNPLDPQSLSHRRVSAICEDKSGTVWVGTMGGGLNVFDKKTNTFSHFRHDPKNGNSLRSDTVSAILEDSDGNLWIGNGEVLSVYNQKEKNFTHTYLHHPFLPTNGGATVFTIYEDRQQVFWLGTNNGMMSLDRKTGKTEHYPYDPDNPEGISDYWALAIFEDSKGNLWIGAGSQALNQFERQTGKFNHFRHDSRTPGSIASNTVSSIYEDSKGNLWFGTGEGGLCRFDHASATFMNYTEKQGLAGNAIYSIVEDNEGYIWLGTNKGLSKFSSATETFTNYDADDGLQSKLFTSLYTDGACFKGKDGTLYFGGTSGLNAFNPVAIRSNPYVPPVVITQFRLFDKPLPGKSEAKEITLDYDQNFFSLEFAALNYTNPGKNQYAYQLEGVNKEWVLAGTNRLASFTNVAPGSYRFKVKGANNDGLWNDNPTTFAIVIRPPFWRTWWAYTLYALLFVTGLVLARREVVRRERLRADLKINQLESDKLRELDSLKSDFFANISHEFRTPLTLIQGTVTKLEKEDAFPGRQVDYRLIERNADRLLQLINQLLDLSKIEAGKLDLHPKPGELAVFLKILAASFASLYQSKHIAYTYDLPEEPLHVRFDADKLEKILVNLLSNAYKFTSEGGEVTFSARVSEKDATYCKLHLTISDSGIGIPAEQLPRVFDRFYQADASATRSYEGTGIGLALVKELVDLHGGIISVESSQEKGTTFFVRLPLELTSALTSQEDALLPGTFTQKVNSLPEPHYEEEQASGGRKVQEQAVQVLVVEDNTELRRFLTQNLLREYTVLEAENGLKGYEQAIRTIPDVIISDVMMPGLDGVSLCGKIKADERTSHIPLILLTAKADVESRLQGLSTGADDYLTKPFNLEELQLRIRNLLESRKRMQERFGKQIHLDPQQISVTSTDERFLQRVLSLMEANLSNASFDVEAFSKEIGLSRTHLHRKLTALTGQAPNEFIRTFRLKRAASLLQQQHGNVSEIAYAVGFSTLNYFTKCFKDFYGVTPSEYVRNPTPSKVAGR